jgi:hypothetical protein
MTYYGWSFVKVWSCLKNFTDSRERGFFEEQALIQS